MSRYTAERQPFRGRYRVGGEPWVVSVSSGGLPIIDLSEAEAHIIAFALNAVADGYGICRNPGQDEFVGFRIGQAVYEPIQYDGPTDGVKWS